MQIKVTKGKSLLVGGLSRIKILSGKAEAFGQIFGENSEIEVEQDKSIPLTPVSDSLEIYVEISEGGYVTYIDGDLVPVSWKSFSEEICGREGQTVVMVLGGVDSGKTGLVTFLANRLNSCGKKVAVIDADTGQSSIGPPTLISLGLVDEPIVHLSSIKLVDAFFVGSTSPNGVLERSIVGVISLIREAFDLGASVVIVDTTGWVGDRGGRELKLLKIQAVRPDYLVLVEKEFGELFHIAKAFMFSSWTRVKNLDSPPLLRARSRDTRREIRKRLFSRHLEGGKIVDIPIGGVNIRYSFIGSGRALTSEELTELGLNPNKIYVEASSDSVIVYCREPCVEIEAIREKFGMDPRVISREDLDGILVCLRDKSDKFLGLGILKDLNIENRTLSIYTNCDMESVRTVEIGHIKVREDGEEVGWLSPWSI